MTERIGMLLYLHGGQFLVWLALFSALLRPLPLRYPLRLAILAALLLVPVIDGHAAVFYLAGWFGMVSVPTLAVALYALRQDGKHPLATRYWALLFVLNAVILVPFLAWPANGYEWGYQTSFGLLLLGGATVLMLTRKTGLFWLVTAAALAWLAWPGTSPNGFNYLVDGLMLIAAPVVLMIRLIKRAWRAVVNRTAALQTRRPRSV